MTNADKYLKDGVDVGEFWNDFIDYIDEHSLRFNANNFETFLNDNAKPTLTEDEKVILRNAHSPNGTIAYYVGRDKDTKNLFMRTKYDLYQYDWGCFDTLFQFIQPRRRI